MAALRELLLAAERDRQPLDDALLSFSRALLLSPLSDTTDLPRYTAENAHALSLQFLTLHPQCELLLRVWPDQHGAGRRWERRESFATFLHVVTHLLVTQQQHDATRAEAFALRVVREKISQLEKLLTWSDKPLIEYRTLELLASVAKVSGATARELVRLFNFQCPSFVKLATRRWKKREPQDDGDPVSPSYQIRAAYVTLVMTLTACPEKSVQRFATKEGGLTCSLFKSMDGDTALMLTTIFNKLRALVLDNLEMDQKSKVVVYNATCVHQLIALLHVGEDESIRHTALGVLNALFFERSALYVVPQNHALRLFWAKMAQHEDGVTSDQAYALKVIRNAIGTIGLNELIRSTQAQTLVLWFLTTYPGFLAEYLAALSLQLEPKATYRWFCSASLVQKLLLCSLDAGTNELLAIQSTDASWCSAHFIASRLIAPSNYRKELSRCIQHSHQLVIYSSLGIIEATLTRYERLAPTLEALELASPVQSALRCLLPSAEVLVSLLLKLCASHERRSALIYVRALTVFRLYLECLPHTMREVKVDLTKILRWHYLDTHSSTHPMASLIVGEMLRLLLAVDIVRLRFLVTNANTGMHSKLQQMLLLYAMTPSRALQELCGKVLQRTLLAADIFGYDVDGRASEEVASWLDALRQSRSKTCAKFTEELMRAVLVDVFLYVAVGRRVVSETASSSPSPVTIALVQFLNSRDEGDESLGLFAFRGNPCVVAFAVRILLALIPTNECPDQLISLIVSSNTSSFQDENEESLSEKSDGKKRLRSEESELSSEQDDAYMWLQEYCKALVLGQQAGSYTFLTKKASASRSKWQCVRDPIAFTTALMEMPPAEVVSAWNQLVRDCATIDRSFTPLFYYLSAHPNMDLLSLLKRQTDRAAAQALTKALPVSLVLQHVLLNFAGKDAKDRNVAISTIRDMIRQRVYDEQLTATEAARMCEQLLWFFASSHTVVLDESHQLCELLLQLVTLALVFDVPFTIWKRIVSKLQSMAIRAIDGALWRQLTAVLLVALRVSSSNKPDIDLSLLCDFRLLFHHAGVPLVATLASYVPTKGQIRVLDKLLHESSATTSSAPHVVLVAQTMASLERITEYSLLSQYDRANLLATKLWQLLACQIGKRWRLSFFTTGFTVLCRFGGVQGSIGVKSVETFLVPLMVQFALTVASSTELLRAILAAIQNDNDAAPFPIVFETHLLQRLQNENEDRVKFVLVAATLNVFTRIRNSALRRFAEDLSRHCFERLLLRSQESYVAEVALLRHVSIDAVQMDASDSSYTAVVKKLIDFKRENEPLTSAQLLGLLFLLRSPAYERIDANLLPVLVQSGLFALLTAEKDQKICSASRQALEFKATILLAETALDECSKRRENDNQRSAVLKTVLPHLAQACDAMQQHSGNFAYQSFVALTSLFLRLVGNEAKALKYDFGAHFDAVVHHPCFVYTLQTLDDDNVRIGLVRVVSCLARITGTYTRSLLQTLLGAYSMSLSLFDRTLRVLFEAFEAQNVDGLTLSSFGYRFGASSTLSLSTKDAHNDLVDDSAWLLSGGLEQNRVRVTIEHFPIDRPISTADDVLLLQLDTEFPIVEDGNEIPDKQALVYDPAFLFPMLSHFISSSDLPESGVVQQGLLGIAIRATSSSVLRVREYAYGILAHLHECLQATTEVSSDFKAGRQAHLMLDVFRRGVQEPLEQVPSLLTVFLNDALAVLLRPTHVLYPHVNHFLLARPAMDLADVPMFYSLFNSRAPLTYRQERSWLLHTLRRGLRNDTDMVLLERRHVLSMLLSFYSSELADSHTQPLITSILLAALCTPSGGVSLVVKAGLLSWLAMQFLRLGPALAKSDSRKDAAQLLPLMTLLERALQNSVWDELEASHQHGTALQAISAYSAMHAAVTTRRTELKPDDLAKASAVAVLVVRRAGVATPLELLSKALEMVHGDTALESALLVTSNLDRWILHQHHGDVQKTRFGDWAMLLKQVASILMLWHSKGIMTRQEQVRRGFDQLKAVLDQVPTLKQLVISSDVEKEYTSAIL